MDEFIPGNIEQRENEETLRTYCRILRSINESQTDTVILAIDINYRYLYFNNAHVQAMRNAYNCQIRVGMNMLDFFSSESDREIYRRHCDEAFKGQSHSKVQMYGKFSHIYFECFFYPLKNELDEIIGVTVFARNINERIDAEKELKKSEEKWRILFDILPVGVSILDKDGKISQYNQALEKIVQISGNDLKNKKYPNRKYIHPDESAITERDFPSNRAIAEQRCIQNMIIGIIKENDDRIWTEVSAAPLPLPDEKCVVVTTDITDRMNTTTALLEREQQLKESQVLAKLGNWEYDLSTQKIAWSDQVFRMYERDPAEGPPTEEEETSYYTAEQAEKLRDNAAFVIKTGKKIEYEFTARLKNGRDISFLGILQPINGKDGKIKKLFGTLQDITEKKNTEKVLKFHSYLINNIIQGVNVIRLSDGLIIDTNKRFDEMFGYDTGELIGKHVSILNASLDTQPETMASFILSILKRSGHWEGNIRNRKKDGENFWCRASSRVIQHPEYGSICISLHEDITEQKIAELQHQSDDKKLKEQYALLEQKNAALRELSEQLKIEAHNVEEKIKKNLQYIVLPIILKLKEKSSQLEMEYITLIEESLKNITSSMGERLSDKMTRLSQKEVEICGLLANGLSSKDIGKLMNISHRTIETHRNNIRRKLKLTRDENLITFLMDLKK